MRRRVLLFLALFGLGLAVLLWLARDGAKTVAPPAPPPVDAPDTPGEAAQVGQVELRDASGQVVRTTSSGPIDAYVKDDESKRLVYHVIARDHRSIEAADPSDPSQAGAYDFTDIEIQQYDRESGALESEAKAARARAKLSADISQGVLDQGAPIRMFEVEAALHLGSRFAPLRFSVPALEGLFGARRYTSQDQVHVEGRGLVIDGRGLAFDGTAQTLRIRERPSAQVELEDGSRARLDSARELAVDSRPDLGPDVLQLVANEAARLVLEGGRDPLGIDADVLRLFGTLAEGADSRFVPTRAEAEGRVVLRPREGAFAGARAIVEFDASGRVTRATLDGEPRVDLALRGEALAPVPPELLVEGETLTVALTGAGPLEVSFAAGQSFDFTGPAELSLPAVGAVLRAGGGMSGAIGADGAFHELTAREGAELAYESSVVRTRELVVRAIQLASGATAVRAIAAGETRSSGTLADGSPFDLLLREGGEVERSRAGLRVVEGRGVELDVRGARAFTARAMRVRDFDVEELSFTADGAVAFENALGRGRGDRLVARGPLAGELSGSLAHLESSEGTFDARAIEFSESSVLAIGDVAAVVTLAGVRYALSSSWVSLGRDVDLEDSSGTYGALLDAGGRVQASVVRGDDRIDLACGLLRGIALEGATEDELIPGGVVAKAGVEFAYAGALDLRGSGDRLEVAADLSGRLFPAPGEKTHLAGALPQEDVTIDMSSSFVDFSPARLVAENVEAEIDGLTTALAGARADPSERTVRAVAGRMACDRASILMSESVFVGGHSVRIGDWSLDAPQVLFASAGEIAEGVEARLQDVTAWGGVSARLGTMGTVQGSQVQLVEATRRLSLAGSPAHFDQPLASWSSDRFELDLTTSYLRSGAGEVHGAGAAEGSDWTLRYASLEPIPSEDDALQVLREPVLVSGDSEVRANWALVWLDVSEWRRVTGQPFDPSMPPSPLERPQRQRRRGPESLFGALDQTDIGGWMREIYLDGEVEYRTQGERRVRGDGFYLDLIDGHGWVRGADLSITVPLADRNERIKIQADWLRHSRDGSLMASNAVATTCTHDSPHFVIRIGDLTIAPRWKEVTRPPRPGESEPRTVELRDGWNVAMESNAVTFGGGLGVPLPRLDVPVEPDLGIDMENASIANLQPIAFGQDSKFGAFISTSVSRELGFFAKRLHKFLTLGRVAVPSIEGKSTYRASYLGSRGGLVGAQTTIGAPGIYHADLWLDAIYDRGEDHGLVRVDESDRSEARGWLHARGRYLLDDRQWLDVVVTKQSDPGVQAEFFESEFLRFEERETYVHWRRARGVDYWSATLEAPPESYRTEVAEQPAVGFFRGRAEVGEVAGFSLVYSSATSFDYLRRFEGDPRYEDPFVDGLGERDVLRLDSTQRIESPVDLGVLGMRAAPFVEARGTVWDENAAQDDEAGRVGLSAGAELSTTLWRRFEGGAQHAWTPSVAVRADVAHDDTGLPIASFDPRDGPIEGNFLDLGLRSRWEHRERKTDLDFELRQTYANDTAAGEPDGWLPLVVRGTWLSSLRAMPFGVTHDGRYDLGEGDTQYSRSFFGLEPVPSFEVDVGHHFARDLTGLTLYNALSLGGRYAFHSKWEVEGRETFSTRDGGDRLSSSLLLRRLGHDFVLETEVRFVAGEGGTSVRFNLLPLFAWKRSDLGLLDRWRSARE